jgi:hypothetical protein
MLPLFTVITGRVRTVTVSTAVFDPGQPTELVPVTEYDVVVAGDTVKLPPLMVYVLAPPGTTVKFAPVQIVPLLAVTNGSACTVTVDTAVLDERQPTELLPKTE